MPAKGGGPGNLAVSPAKIKAAAKMPGLRTPSPAFSRNLQSTFGPLAKAGVGARSGGKLAPASVQREAATQEHLRQLKAEHPLEYTGVKQKNGEWKIQKVHPQIAVAVPAGLPGLNLVAGAAGAGRAVQTIGAATGAKGLSQFGGKVASEAINLPTQVLPAIYHTGKAGIEAAKGHPQELHELVKSFAKESPIAHLATGDVSGAIHAAGEHPLGTALEVTGAAAAVDRTLGALGHLSNVDAAKLADGQVVSRRPREYPREAVPEGGATVPSRPYHKGLIRPAVERKFTERRIPTSKVSQNLRRAFDRFEGEHLRVTRQTRDLVSKRHHETVKGVANKGAIVPFGQWLADPSVINRDTGRAFAAEHLDEMIAHLRNPPEGEFPQEAAIREANLKHLEGLRGKNLSQAHEAAMQVAADKRALEPELVKHRVYTPETIRAAKLIPAFQFHFRNENPWVEPTVPVGESPFRLNGQPVPVDEVAQKLAEKGVNENQLSFVSTRPFQNANSAFRSGRIPGGAKVAKGHLTGQAFMRGLFDPEHDAALRQHLTDAGIINRARGDIHFAQEYVHSRAAIARLLEDRVGRLPEPQQAAVRDYIQNELRAGPGVHFEAKGGKSPWQRAMEAREHLKALYPDIQLEPVRVAHPYATKPYREGLGQHMDLAAVRDMLDPENHGPEQEFWKTRAPEEQAAQHDINAGPVGLAHQEIVDRVRKYERDLGQAHLGRMPASFWRKANVAFSVRHVPGVTGEIGIRALMNNIGALSGLRGTRALHEILAYGDNHPDPTIKLGAQRLRAQLQGTVASQALEATKKVPGWQLRGTKLERPAEWWTKGETRKITGAPLRAIRMAVKGFNRTTNAILATERKAIEHPPQIAGYGKHLNNEFGAMHGKRLKVIGAMRDVEKAFLRGQLDPKAIDHAAAVGREYFGDWMRSSPEFRKVQAVSPFAQWYLNSLRFIYHTMPVHHPVKAGLLAAIEGATREQRLAEGQEYQPWFHLSPASLEASQQGSIPSGAGRLAQEYYTPQGAVSEGLNTALGAVLPWASGIWMTAHGINPVTNRPLEEKNAEGKKEAIRDQGQLALLAAQSLAEGFIPPYRYYESLQKKPAGYVFRPFRTEKTRLEGPKKKATGLGGSLGGKLGGGLGGSLGGSLK